MTREEIIAMAREVGLLPDNSHPTPETRAMRKRCEVVKRFAALVAEREREACAIMCEVHAATVINDGKRPAWAIAHECAASIRARGTP